MPGAIAENPNATKSCLFDGVAVMLIRHCFSHSQGYRARADNNHWSGGLMKASSLSFYAAVVMVIAGMVWGIVMAISKDHSTMPAHAHLNLLGWVSLFLFGMYYRLHPEIDRSTIASIQVWIWIIFTVILAIGVALVHSGREIGDPIAAVASLIVVADMLLFGWLVIRGERTVQVS